MSASAQDAGGAPPWTPARAAALIGRPFNDLLFEAQTVHRRNFDPNRVQVSTLLSIKTGGCPEDCAYCPQSARFETGVAAGKLMPVEDVLAAARRAGADGATRFCMGAAWRGPAGRDLEKVAAMIEGVRALGLETCATLGMLAPGQAERLRAAGLDYYNHNIDSSDAFYGRIVTTRRYADRLETLARVREAGIAVCSGGILGMGETREDRAAMLATLAGLDPPPESVPINMLVRTPGTPLARAPDFDPLEFVRTVAAARVMMPASMLRLSAGRLDMPEPVQALCFLAGANSIFAGEKLLTAPNPDMADDYGLFARLGIRPAEPDRRTP